MTKPKSNTKKVDEKAFNECFKSGGTKGTRHNPWGTGSKKNPTNSSQTTGP